MLRKLLMEFDKTRFGLSNKGNMADRNKHKFETIIKEPKKQCYIREILLKLLTEVLMRGLKMKIRIWRLISSIWTHTELQQLIKLYYNTRTQFLLSINF